MSTWVKRFTAGMLLVLALNGTLFVVGPGLPAQNFSAIGIMGQPGPDRMW